MEHRGIEPLRISINPLILQRFLESVETPCGNSSENVLVFQVDF